MQYGLYINGKWIKGSEYFDSLNPATGRSIGKFASANEEDVKSAIDSASHALEKWSETPPPKRAEIVLRAAQMLRKEKERLARLEVMEMGKVLAEARGDVQEAIDVAEYMAGEGRRLFGHTTTSELRNKFAMTVRRPVGVVGLITPWNFPIAIPAWKIMPALVCGNSILFKPSSDTPLCAIELVKIMERAGVPKGVLNMVTGQGSAVGKEIVASKKIMAISFTGSRDTGDWITKNAGIKKIGLELGGKNGIIVMDDADIGNAVDGAIWGGFGTTGQRCTAASRVIVHEKVKEKFTRLFVERARKLRTGSGLLKTTDVGPLINRDAQEKTHKYVAIGLDEGAKLLCGGAAGSGSGFFYKPTIFEADSGMRISREEIFGPVVSLLTCHSLDDAIQQMNSIEYGLSSSIYTNDIRNAFTAIEKIEAGITYVNSSTIGAETHLPFGGVKQTGNGAREGGILGIDEFSEIKTVYIDYSGKLQRAQIDTEE